MNKIFFTSTMLMMVILSHQTSADQIQINITAKVTSKTCTIATGKTDFLVSLMQGNLRDAAVGVPFSPSSFSVNLEDCPSNIKVAHVTFSAESDPVFPNLLKIASDDNSDAKGIAIGLYDSDIRNIDIRNNSIDFVINHEIMNNYLFFTAAYIKTNDKASPGKVKSFAYFEVSYD